MQASIQSKVIRAVRGGFTLVEVTLAIGVAAIAVMSLLAMAAIGHRMGRLAVDDTFSATIAQDIFTEMKTESFSALTTGHAGDSRRFDRDGSSIPPSSGDPYYKCEINVTKTSDHLATVNLILVWPNVNNFADAPNTNRYYTRIANLTPY